MSTYKIVINVTGSEVWHVQADDPDEAEDTLWEEMGYYPHSDKCFRIAEYGGYDGILEITKLDEAKEGTHDNHRTAVQ